MIRVVDRKTLDVIVNDAWVAERAHSIMEQSWILRGKVHSCEVMQIVSVILLLSDYHWVLG